MNELRGRVLELDLLTREQYRVATAVAKAETAVIEAAIAAGITARTVFVIDSLGWYLDPPANGSTWLVSFGSPPETVPVTETDDAALPRSGKPQHPTKHIAESSHQ